MSFSATLAALAIAANKADKATATANDKATAHAPFALAAILLNKTMTVEGWVNAACDAANNGEGITSGKDKRNASALREHGYGGLYNMAQTLKLIEDNMAKHSPAILAATNRFVRLDLSGDMRRNYLMEVGAMLPAEAKLTDYDAIVAAYDAIEDEAGKAKDADLYWKAVKAPTSFAAYVKEVKDAIKTKGDAFGDRVGKMVDAIAKLDLEELKARQTELSALLAAIKGASDRLESEAETATANEVVEAIAA